MPVVSDGHGRYTSVDESELYSEHPRDLLDKKTYEERIAIARRVVLNVVLHLGKGRPLNDAVYMDSARSEDLANFVDGIDGSRSRRVRSGQKFAGGYRILSPQDIKMRRRRLFSLDDLPVLLHSDDRHDDYRLLDVLRWHLIHEAILRMKRDGELWFMNGIWQVDVIVMDLHRGCGRRRSRRKAKNDQRPFHGRPNRDRRLIAA